MSELDDEENSNDPLNSAQLQFHVEEYRLLKGEILQNDRAKTQIEILTFASIGLIYWFYFVYRGYLPIDQWRALWFFPSLIVFFGFIWSRSFVYRSIEIGDYIKSVEAIYASPKLGWENRITVVRAASKRLRSDTRFMTIWIITFIFTVLVGILYGPSRLTLLEFYNYLRGAPVG